MVGRFARKDIWGGFVKEDGSRGFSWSVFGVCCGAKIEEE